MRKLLLCVAGSILGLWLAQQFVPGVTLSGGWKMLLLIGAVLGAANFFVKPVLDALTFPLRVLTLGLFGLIINLLLVWLVDVAFLELHLAGVIPLLETTFLVWLANFALNKWL